MSSEAADGLLSDALSSFVNQNYDNCLATLHKILKDEKRKNDPRVQQNISVAEFFRGGCIEVEKIQTDLRGLCRLDSKPVSKPATTATSAPKSPAPTSATAPTSSTEKKEVSHLCLEYDGHEVALYNEAVLWYHSRQHTEAIRTLQPLFAHRDNLGVPLAIHCAVLLWASLMAVYTKTNETTADEEITQIRGFLDSNKDGVSKLDEELAKENPLHRTPVKQQIQFLTAHYHMLKKEYPACLNALQSVLSSCVQNGALSASSTNGGTGLVAAAAAAAQGSGNFLPTLCLSNLGVVHLAMNKPQLASLYFAKAVEAFERSKAAVTPYQSASQAEPATPGTGLGPSRSGSAMCHVLYNAALCLIMREKYELAFRTLVVCTPLLHTFPCLWLKLAQCCVRTHESLVRKEKEDAIEQAGQGSLIQSKTTPSGAIAYHLPVRGSTTVTTFHLSTDACAANPMSLTFADKCLRNAHYLLLRQGRLIVASKPGVGTGSGSTARSASPTPGTASASTGATATSATEGSGGAGSEPTSPEAASAGSTAEADSSAASSSASTEEVLEALSRDTEFSPLLQAVYVNMAYVALMMNNPSVALYEARQLLKMPACSRENKIVLLSYIAESLCWLSRPSDALQILHNVNLQEILQDKMLEQNRRNAEALFVNLAIVHIMQGKYQRAQECVKQFIARSSSNHSILLQIYLDLMQGNRDRVMEMLRKHANAFTTPL